MLSGPECHDRRHDLRGMTITAGNPVGAGPRRAMASVGTQKPPACPRAIGACACWGPNAPDQCSGRNPAWPMARRLICVGYCPVSTHARVSARRRDCRSTTDVAPCGPAAMDPWTFAAARPAAPVHLRHADAGHVRPTVGAAGLGSRNRGRLLAQGGSSPRDLELSPGPRAPHDADVPAGQGRPARRPRLRTDHYRPINHHRVRRLPPRHRRAGKAGRL